MCVLRDIPFPALRYPQKSLSVGRPQFVVVLLDSRTGLFAFFFNLRGERELAMRIESLDVFESLRRVVR